MIDRDHAQWLIDTLTRKLAEGYTHFALYDLDHHLRCWSKHGYTGDERYEADKPWVHPDERD